MTPGMQFRLWLREASRTQVVTTATVALAVVALITVSVIPAHRSSSVAASAGSGSGTGGSGIAGGGVGGVGGGIGGAANSGGAVNSGGGAPGSSGASSDAGGVPSAAGSSDAGLGGAGSVASGGSASGSTGAGSSGSGSTAVDISKATDRGVNPSDCGKPCVKLGFLIANVGGLAASGFALNLRTDMSQVIDAYVKYQNAHGGINGRQIVAVKRPTDPTSQSDQSTACTSMIDDNHVFGVVDTATLIYAATQQCFSIQTRTPYVHSYAESADFQAQGAGYDISVPRNLDRIAREWAVEAKSLAFLKGGEKVGILTDNCEPNITVINKVLKPMLLADGAASVYVGATDCNADAAQAQPPAIQTQMCTAGVTHVFPAANFLSVQVFLNSADGSPCGQGPNRYRYFASDYDGISGDLFAQHFPATQWDGVLAINNGYTGWVAAGNPMPDRMKFCSDILVAAGLPPIKDDYSNSEAIAMCDHFFIMVAAAQNAGGNLTRSGWAYQAQRLGKLDNAATPYSIFQPG